MSKRTKIAMEAYRDAIYAELEQTHPQSGRHVYYRMTVLGLVEKTDKGYLDVMRQLTKMRRAGRVPYSWLVDDGRQMHEPWTSTSIKEVLEETARGYRRNFWRDSEHYVEVWCESLASGGLLESVTEELGVPLCACRGFPSLTFLYDGGGRIADRSTLRENKNFRITKPVHIIYFGDWDPSGKKISESIQRDLEEFSNTEIHFERVAVTPKQIKKMNLPTKGPKDSSHMAGWTGETVELEALPVPVLLDLCRGAIEKYIDVDHLNAVKKAEARDRTLLLKIARQHG